jgi:hypothetical protein
MKDILHFLSGAGAVVAIILVTGASGCQESANTSERMKVDEQQLQYVLNQPAPVFDWSLERHLLIQLYQSRNKAVHTYTYVRNAYTGKVMSWCPSIGFPIPANTQLTNSMAAYSQGLALPQAEPNGLYSSPSTKGTYVFCLSKEGKAVPRYFEADVEAYVTPMTEVNGMLVEADGAVPTIQINPTR